MDNNFNDFLPVGTVVLLKGGNKELMITSYCIIPSNEIFDKNEKNYSGKIFEYGACTYPEGIINSDQVYGFNHDQIEKVCHFGYRTDAHKKYSDYMINSLREIKNTINKIEEEPTEGN